MGERIKGYELLGAAYGTDTTRGLNVSGVPAATAKRVAAYHNLRTVYGYSEKQALAAMEQSFSPEFQARLKKDKERTEKGLKNMSWKTVRDELGATGSWGLLGWGSTPDTSPQAEAVQKQIAERVAERYAYWRNTDGMSHEVALANAAADVRKSHNVSNVTGRGTLMLYPPEQVYPKGKDGTHKYIGEQLLEHVNRELKAAADANKQPFKPLTLKEVEIAGTSDTAREAAAKAAAYNDVKWPSYEVFYKKGDKWEYLPVKFRAEPDPANLPSAARARQTEQPAQTKSAPPPAAGGKRVDIERLRRERAQQPAPDTMGGFDTPQ